MSRSGAKIGQNIFVGDGIYVELENAHLLEIQDDVVLSAFVKIILHDSSLNNVSGGNILYGKVTIKKNAYIGVGTIILPGSIIGENTIVGAGSLVKGYLKKNSVYAGVPAKYICSISALEKRWRKRKSNQIFLKQSKKWHEKNS